MGLLDKILGRKVKIEYQHKDVRLNLNSFYKEHQEGLEKHVQDTLRNKGYTKPITLSSGINGTVHPKIDIYWVISLSPRELEETRGLRPDEYRGRRINYEVEKITEAISKRYQSAA